MALIDVIQHPSERSDEIVFRVPQQGAGEFKFGSQLIVREGQAAVFFRDGKALDTFGPGRHTLNTNNLPLLTRHHGDCLRRRDAVHGRGLFRLVARVLRSPLGNRAAGRLS